MHRRLRHAGETDVTNDGTFALGVVQRCDSAAQIVLQGRTLRLRVESSWPPPSVTPKGLSIPREFWGYLQDSARRKLCPQNAQIPRLEKVRDILQILPHGVSAH